MKPLTPELERLLRHVPRRAHQMIEAVVLAKVNGVPQVHIRQHEADWTEADSLTGLDVTDDGTVTLFESESTKLEHTTSDTQVTDLNRVSPFDVAYVEWGGAEPNGFELTEIRIRLHPQVNVGNPKVAKWGLQLFRVLGAPTPPVQDRLVLQPITDVMLIDATGSSEDDYVWDVSGKRIRPKELGDPTPNDFFDVPVTFFFVYALAADGSASDNGAWLQDTSPASITTNGNTLTNARMELAETGLFTATYAFLTRQTATPRMRIRSATYVTATITFTGNPFGDGFANPKPPEDLEFVLEAAVPGGTSVTAEVRNDADTAWVPFVDGQTAADVGVGASGTRTVWPLRVALTTDSTSQLTPELIRLGLQHRTRRDLTPYATLQPGTGGSRISDLILRTSEIAEAVFDVIYTGRRDYQTPVHDLLTQSNPADIELQVFWGHPDLARQYWLGPWIYRLDGIEPHAASCSLICISPLADLQQILPKPVTVGMDIIRAPLVYENETLKDASDDLLDNQIAVPARYRGPGIPDDTTTVTKTIAENAGALSELDALASLARGAFVFDGRRVKFVNLLASQGVRHVFMMEDILPVSVAPGFQYRAPFFFVPWRWDPVQREYADEVRNIHQPSLDALGVARLEGPQTAPDIVSQWIDTEALAMQYAQDVTDTLGTGRIVWAFRTNEPHPELEHGDVVAVQTDWFVARDPTSARALKGRVFGVGRIVSCEPGGLDFEVWILSFGDILTAAEAIVVDRRLARVAQLQSNAFVNLDTDAIIWQAGYLQPNGSVGADHFVGVDVTTAHVRPGSVITGFQVRALHVAGLGTGQLVVRLLRIPESDPASFTVLGSLSVSSSASWQTATHTLATPEEVAYDGNGYAVDVQMRPSQALADIRLGWVNVLHNAPGGL